MQQHALVGLADLEDVTHLLSLEPVDVSQSNDEALLLRQALDLTRQQVERLRKFDAARSGESSPHAAGGRDHMPRSSKRVGSTVGSSGSIDDHGTLRFSRTPLVLARFDTMVNIQVFRLERPSKASSPSMILSHASCATSWAIASEATNVRATRTNEA